MTYTEASGHRSRMYVACLRETREVTLALYCAFASSPDPSHWRMATAFTAFPSEGRASFPVRAISSRVTFVTTLGDLPNPYCSSAVASNGRHPVASTTAPTVTLLAFPSRR